MLAVAQHHVRTRAAAEEVVQEAWLGVLKGLDRFEGRSSLKTWILRILVNTAKTRGVRESRTVPYSSLAPLPPQADAGWIGEAGPSDNLLTRRLLCVPGRVAGRPAPTTASPRGADADTDTDTEERLQRRS